MERTGEIQLWKCPLAALEKEAKVDGWQILRWKKHVRGEKNRRKYRVGQRQNIAGLILHNLHIYIQNSQGKNYGQFRVECRLRGERVTLGPPLSGTRLVGVPERHRTRQHLLSAELPQAAEFQVAVVQLVCASESPNFRQIAALGAAHLQGRNDVGSSQRCAETQNDIRVSNIFTARLGNKTTVNVFTEYLQSKKVHSNQKLSTQCTLIKHHV